jgi:hypothetical protein
MQGLINDGTLAIALAFIVPGYIIGAIRTQFVAGRRQQKIELLVLESLALSLVNLCLWYPALVAGFPASGAVTAWNGMAWLCAFLVSPAVIGAFLGIAALKNWWHGIANRLGTAPLHPMPTAWDWKFAQREQTWMYVTLKDDTKFAGFCGARSFISSEPAERDLYIQEVYEIGEDQVWKPKGSGLYIASGEIRSIEFWPIPKEEQLDEQQQPGLPEGLSTAAGNVRQAA